MKCGIYTLAEASELAAILSDVQPEIVFQLQQVLFVLDESFGHKCIRLQDHGRPIRTVGRSQRD